MVSAGDVGCSIFMIVVIGPVAVSMLPWYQFTGDTTLGIDLGTTYSVASICSSKKARSVIIDEGTPLVPSMVSYSEGKIEVGVPAEKIQLEDPQHVVTVAKRFMGKTMDDTMIKKELKNLPFNIVEGENGFAAAEIDGRRVAPEEVGGRILKKLKDKAEREVGYWKHLFGFRFYTATISVPVSFNGQQKAATHRAAKEAGFSMVRLIEEPVAAAVAYDLKTDDELDVLVYDMGGGTLDVALLRLQRDTNTFILVSTAGEPNLGGSDFDRCLIDFTASSMSKSLSDLTAPQRAHLTKAVELAKRELASVESAVVSTPWGEATITREDLKTACSELVERALKPVDEVAGLVAEEDDLQVVLAGGSSRLHAVRELLIERFGESKVHSDLDADMAISLGASKAYGC
eukprot:TRINITY_DN550_c1_g6_i1.p1 TRINITY_DN550_c1_g6~~TRINITY_DN550_c1_g6_i1.p1  ORF type:complete len:409 (+),score=68.30 TRINITY_DN550_c1_g6_i1:23-1228(+)